MYQRCTSCLEELSVRDRGAVTIKFPIIADPDVSIAKMYGMIHPESNSTRSVRGVFIIDPDNIIQAIYFYPSAVGRSTSELLRAVTALETTRENKVLTPVNWKAGNDVLVPYLPANTQVSQTPSPEGYYENSWFLVYKKANTR